MSEFLYSENWQDHTDHKWAYLGNPAIACLQCMKCKIFKPYDKRELPKCLTGSENPVDINESQK